MPFLQHATINSYLPESEQQEELRLMKASLSRSSSWKAQTCATLIAELGCDAIAEQLLCVQKGQGKAQGILSLVRTFLPKFWCQSELKMESVERMANSYIQ